MLVKPNTALTGVPSGRAIDGRAWKARNRKPEPSIRTRCGASAGAGLSSATRSTIPAGLRPEASVSGGVAGPLFEHEQARAIRAHDRLVLDAEKDARVAQRPAAAVAGDHA